MGGKSARVKSLFLKIAVARASSSSSSRETLTLPSEYSWQAPRSIVPCCPAQFSLLGRSLSRDQAIHRGNAKAPGAVPITFAAQLELMLDAEQQEAFVVGATDMTGLSAQQGARGERRLFREADSVERFQIDFTALGR